jgi:hypothetical protein
MKCWVRRGAIAALVIVLAGGVLFEVVTRVGRGWLGGEPFYQGRPASYWANEIERWETRDPVWATQIYQRRPALPPWAQSLLPEPSWPPLLDGDPEALAILKALRDHPSSDVQDWARIGIERIDNDERGPYKFKHPDVIVAADLFEVDEMFFQQVAKGRWRSQAELEKLEGAFLVGPEPKQTGESLAELLDKQTPLHSVKNLKIANGKEGHLLSHFSKETRCPPTPAQARNGHKDPQVIAEGLSLGLHAQVTEDRRFVRVKLIEKASELEGIDLVSVLDEKGRQAAAAHAELKEWTFMAPRTIPDGAILVLPLQYRPPEVKEKNRWLVVRLEARIYIQAEGLMDVPK